MSQRHNIYAVNLKITQSLRMNFPAFQRMHQKIYSKLNNKIDINQRIIVRLIKFSLNQTKLIFKMNYQNKLK